MADFLSHAASAIFRLDGPYQFVWLVTVGYALSAIARLIPVRRKQIAGYRPRPARAAALGAGGALLACGIAACAVALPIGEHSPSAPIAPVASAPRGDAPGKSLQIGVFEPGEWDNWQPVSRFASSVGRDPGTVLLYSGFPGSFNTRFAAMAYAHRAVPFIQLIPSGGVTMRQVADGKFDAALRSYAGQVRDFRHPVHLSFAPEANGNWYGWGWGRTSPHTWVAAWRHVVALFRDQNASNVTWTWTMNVGFPHSGPVADYWPGDAYVGQVGIDGYFVRSTDTFSKVFGPTLDAVRRVTSKPVIVSETAVGPAAGTDVIADLFAGVVANHIRTIVWFDQAQHGGLYHQDWRLEDNPAALAEFRAQVHKHGA